MELFKIQLAIPELCPFQYIQNCQVTFNFKTHTHTNTKETSDFLAIDTDFFWVHGHYKILQSQFVDFTADDKYLAFAL